VLYLVEQRGDPSRVDLSGADLSELDLSSLAIQEVRRRTVRGRYEPPWFASEVGALNLRGAKLAAAVLRGTHLTSAVLEGVLLADANLQGADLWGCRMRKAVLADANAAEADFSFADLEEAAFLGANLRGATLAEAKLRQAHLWDADLESANLSGADLREAALNNTNLRGANLAGAHLEHLDLSMVRDLSGAIWHGALLDHTRLRAQALGPAIGDELLARNSGHYQDYARALAAYQALHRNFLQLGLYSDARWAYQKERQMERALKAPARVAQRFTAEHQRPWQELSAPHKAWIWLTYTTDWLLDWAQAITLGYGDRPWRLIPWILLLVLVVFPSLYWFGGGLGWPATEEREAIATLDTVDYLLYSLAAFTTTPSYVQPLTRVNVLLTTGEGLLGLFALLIFVLSLGRRLYRS